MTSRRFSSDSKENSSCQQKLLPSGSTSRCAAGGQTTGPDKRAVDSHVQSTGLAARSVRGAKANRSSPVNDRVGSMKNLEDYLLKKPRKKKPVKISESPIFSPDTLDALHNAEELLKKAQETILEASYDVASSPERERSARSDGQEEDDARYIRDVVATRFHEANESARIFTRPSTRPLADRICRPVIRQRRTKRTRSRIAKISNEKSASTSRLKSIQETTTNLEKTRRTYSSHLCRDQQSIRQHTISDFPNPWTIDNQNVTNLLRVQRGPRVDIPNELTITNVEKVDISPKPRSSFPVQQNSKTYEFRHDSCAGKITDSKKNERETNHSTESVIEDVVISARDSTEVTEKSREENKKSRGFVAASNVQGSGSDLVQNKLARSIPPKELEGHADNVGTSIANRTECIPEENEKSQYPNGDKKNDEDNGNIGECFIDFLRRSGNFQTACGKNIFKDFPIVDTNDEINIIDRAIDKLVSELRHEKGHQQETNLPSSSKKSQNNCVPEKEVDGHLVEEAAGKIENFMLQEFQEPQYFVEEWLPEEINLEAPNLVHLEKTLNNFDTIIYKVLRGTQKLEAIMCEYSNEAEIAPGLTNHHWSHNSRLLASGATKDRVNELELKSPEYRKEKDWDNYENRAEKDTIKSCEELIGSCGNSTDISAEASRYNNELRRKFAKELAMKGESNKKLVHHPRFSTPLNNDLKITRQCRLNTDCKSNEFARFLIGIQSSKGLFDYHEGPSTENVVFPRVEIENADDKIVQKKNEFHPALSALPKNDDELQKNILPNEMSKKYKNQPSHVANGDKAHEIQDSPCDFCSNCPIGENRGSSGRKSPIQDSAIGRVTDQSEKISIATKLVDENSTKKDYSKIDQCAPSENDATKSKQSANKHDENSRATESIVSEKIESTVTKTLTMKNNAVLSVQPVKKSENKSSIALQPEKVDQTVDNKNEHSEKSKKATNDKNSLAGSTTGSSLRDRTSFDISTVYSEDFEEPVITHKSEVHEKSEAPKSSRVKSISNCVEVAKTKVSINEDTANVRTSSSSKSEETDKLHNESKQENQYLERSVSIASSKMSYKIQEQQNKTNSAKSHSIELLAEEKAVVECNAQIEEAAKIVPEVQEKSCSDECGVASTSASTKGSGPSSITGESRSEESKNPKDLTNYEVPQFNLDRFNIARSCLNCQGIFNICDCKACTTCSIGKPFDGLEKSRSISTIKTMTTDSVQSVEEDNLCISEQVMKYLKLHSDDGTSLQSNKISCNKNIDNDQLQDLLIFSGRYKIQEHKPQSSEAKDCEKEFENQPKNVSIKLEKWERRETLKIFGIDLNENIEKLDKSISVSSIDLQEFSNFESSVPFHSTPKHFIPSNSGETFCNDIEKLSNIIPQNIGNNHDLKNVQDNVKFTKGNIKISKNDNADKQNDKFNKNSKNVDTDIEDINNAPSSIIIDLTPKHINKYSRCLSEESFFLNPEPIPDEDHANVAADTCSENYSEGELYLPSSCSYSLGEIRISERGSNGTAGSVIQSSAPSAHGMRIYFRNKNSTRHTSDNAIKASDPHMQSPGEVQETDIESICSSQGRSSEGEHHMGKRYMIQIKSIDT